MKKKSQSGISPGISVHLPGITVHLVGIRVHLVGIRVHLVASWMLALTKILFGTFPHLFDYFRYLSHSRGKGMSSKDGRNI